jgi:signal transduction histidine kinase
MRSHLPDSNRELAHGILPDGHGLLGMRDRVTALGGWLSVATPADGGTLVVATLPLSGG